MTRFEVVGIAHHAAASAAEVAAAIARVDPDLVCVQLPHDATPLVARLREVTRFPIALFGHGNGAHAWLPLGETSPELVAVRAGCEVALVDVPFEHAIDAPREWPRLTRVLERLGRSPRELVGRLGDSLGASIGATLVELAAGAEAGPREQAIAAAIRAASRGKRRVLVIVGAAHAANVESLVGSRASAPVASATWRVDLVPFDERRLHATGAHAYPRWDRLARGDADRVRVVARIATLVARGARGAQIPIGPGDAGEAVALAIALARMRDSAQPSVDDVLDAIRLVMVADRGGANDDVLDDDGAFGPLGPILARVLVGARRGEVPAGTEAVPLVADYRAAIAAAELDDGAVRLDIYRDDGDRARSQLLHRLAILGVPGAAWLAGPDPSGDGAHLMFERWRVALGNAAEDALVELAARGTTLRDVATGVLRERLDDPTCDIVTAVVIALHAQRAGLDPIDASTLVDRPARLVELGAALAKLAGDRAFDTLASALAARAIHAFAQLAADPLDDELVTWLDAIHAIYVRACRDSAARMLLIAALDALHARAATPVLLGATTALRHELGQLSAAAIVDIVRMQGFAAFAAPADLGRFLAGMSLLAPSLLARVPGLVATLDVAFASASDDAFLAMVPELRLAFSMMPAHAIERIVVELSGEPPVRKLARLDESELAAKLAELGPGASIRPAAQRVRIAVRARDRWRIVLGALSRGLGEPASNVARRRAAVLDQLDRRERSAGDNPQPIEQRATDVLHWLAETRELFPAEVAMRLHDQAIHRYGLKELLLDPSVLQGLEPTPALASALLAMRGAASPEVVEQIRRVVAAVVRDVRHLFERQVLPCFAGARRMRDPDAPRTASNLDLARTLRRNLRHFDPATHRLHGLDPVFSSRRRRRPSWRLILLVDRSGSMASSVIDTTVLAGVFAAVPALDVHLVLFDTELADLTALLDDPVELLLASSPAGGTDLRKPLAYASTLVTTPRRTLVVMLSDLFHGGPRAEVIEQARALIESGAQLLALTALSPRGADHDHAMAQQLRERGASVTALGPAGLGGWLATRLRA